MDKLPEGSTGIAAKYPLDKGIETDPAVLLADDFEEYDKPEDLKKRWTNYFGEDIVIDDRSDAAYSGKKAIEFRMAVNIPRERSIGVQKYLKDEKDLIFVRYYVKYSKLFDITGSSHNGAGVGAHYEDRNGRATAGIPGDGYNKFLVTLEHWRGDAETPNPGHVNNYVYHADQRTRWGDHFFPTGVISPFTGEPFDYGPGFVSRPDRIPELCRSYCYEFMVKANEPKKRDGRIAVWIDGEIAADFTNIRFREDANIKIDRMSFGLHCHRNPNTEASVWYDNIVMAESYIGPMAK